METEVNMPKLLYVFLVNLAVLRLHGRLKEKGDVTHRY